MTNTSARVLAWFSCGVASAVAAKLAIEKYGDACEVVNCSMILSEHPDNIRFMAEVASWLGRPIRAISSERYKSIDEVFSQSSYMSGIHGAKCTTELKKIPRRKYQREDDVHVFGFTVEERKRIENFEANNPELTCDWILRDRFIRKADCFDILRSAGIEPPVMYGLGFKNNNCLGCVKATSPAYWNLTRRNFPDVFERRARQSRKIGCRLVRLDGERVFLDELPPDAGGEMEDVSCGPACGLFVDS